MSDLISREWLKTAIHNFYYGLKHTPTEEDIQAYIDAAPSVSTKKTGRWEKHSYYKDAYICSACNTGGNIVYKDFKYCPNCGARMVEVVDESVDESVDECKREKLKAEESDKRVVDCKSLPCAHRRYGLLLPDSPQKCVDCLKEMYGIEEVEE